MNTTEYNKVKKNNNKKRTCQQIYVYYCNGSKTNYSLEEAAFSKAT